MTRLLPHIQRWTKSPLVLLVCIAAGAHMGTAYPTSQAFLKPVSEIFMSLLQMCVLPIIFFSITISLSELISSSQKGGMLGRFGFSFTAFTMASAVLGVGFGLLLNPGENFQQLNNGQLRDIVVEASTLVRSTTDSIDGHRDFSFLAFFTQAFPRNIVEAFAKDLALQVLIFSVIFGIALGYSSKAARSQYHLFSASALEAFRHIINGCLYLLPVGVFAQVSAGAATVGLDVLTSMTSFVLCAALAFCILYALVTLMVSWRLNISPLMVIKALKTPIFMALGTRNIIACLPLALENLTRDLGCERRMTELTLPVNAMIGRFGNIFYFAFATIFVTQVYGIQLQEHQTILIIFSAVLAGIASSGSTGIATLGLMSITLEPLGLPVGALMVLFVAIDPILDPLRTLATVYTACGVVPFTHRCGKVKREKGANAAPTRTLT